MLHDSALYKSIIDIVGGTCHVSVVFQLLMLCGWFLCSLRVGHVGLVVEYRTHNREFAGSTLTIHCKQP